MTLLLVGSLALLAVGLLLRVWVRVRTDEEFMRWIEGDE